MAEETVEELEKKEGEPVAEGEADSNEEKEEENIAGIANVVHQCHS